MSEKFWIFTPETFPNLMDNVNFLMRVVSLLKLVTGTKLSNHSKSV